MRKQKAAKSKKSKGRTATTKELHDGGEDEAIMNHEP
jgi:hypothetical protein